MFALAGPYRNATMGCKVIKSKKAIFTFFVAYQQLAKAVEPTVGNLNDPAARTFAGVAA
jgi:hypothetical protein